MDRDDAMALKLLTTLDLDVAAGLRVKKRLADAVEDRRDAVRGALSKGEAAPFCKKWAKLDEKSRKQLVERCVKIKIRAESSRRPPRHRRAACSTAWRCWFLTARRSQDGRVITEK